MAKKILLFLAAVMFIFGMSEVSFSMSCGGGSEHSQHAQVTQSAGGEQSHEALAEAKLSTEEAVENIGNKICPILGEKIDEETKVTYEYQGKAYNFCCAMCIDTFNDDPQKYIKKVEEELQARNEAEKQEEGAVADSQKNMDMQGGQHY